MKQLYLVIGCLLTCWTIQAQDPTFSQFFNQRTYLNPATVGMDGGITLNATYRNQWNQVPGKFESKYLALEAQSCIGAAFGLNLMHDTEGDGLLNTLMTGFDFAYIPDKEGRFRIGLGTYWYQKWIDWDALIFSDQIDAKDGILDASVSQAQRFYDVKPSGVGFKAGFVYTHVPQKKGGTTFSVGGGVTHLGSIRLKGGTREGFYEGNKIPLRVSVHGELIKSYKRYTGPTGYLITIIPQFKYERQGQLNVTNIGLTGHYNSFSLGAFYQNTFPWGNLGNTDAMSFYFGFTKSINKNVLAEFGLSYDSNNVPEFGRSNLGGYTGGVMELSVKFYFKNGSLFCKTNRPKGYNKNGDPICPSPKGRHVNEWFRNQKRKNLN